MDILFEACAGIDVHQKNVVACRIHKDSKGELIAEQQTFSTMTQELLALSDWLAEADITHIAMESTRDAWRFVYNILEGNFEIWVVNAHPFKNVPGRKSNVKDATWLAELMCHGLLRPSFVPSQEHRKWRDPTRMRLNLVRERATFTNRLHKALESANIKLGAVASDLLGVSSRKMLHALVTQENPDPSVLADLALGPLREKREDLILALEGGMNAHHRFVIGELLDHITELDRRIETVEKRIKALCLPFEKSLEGKQRTFLM